MTETTKTLQDLLRPLAITENQYELDDGSIRYMETQLTSPLRAEIARMKYEREKVMAGEIIPGKLAVQMSDQQTEIARLTNRLKEAKEGVQTLIGDSVADHQRFREEIARLTARVEKADELREAAHDLVRAIINPPSGLLIHQETPKLQEKIAAYDATATATTAPDAVLKFEVDDRIPTGEIQIKQGGNVVGRITGFTTPDAPRDHEPSNEFAEDDEISEERIHQACVAAAERTPKTTLHMVSKDKLDAIHTRLDEQATCLSELRERLDGCVDTFAKETDRMNRLLEAERAPVVPTVTDAMVEAYCQTVWPKASRKYCGIVSPMIRDGLEAALAAGEEE